MPGSDHHGHEHHGHAPAAVAIRVAPVGPRGFQPLASAAGARLARVGIAIAVLWAAVAWALVS